MSSTDLETDLHSWDMKSSDRIHEIYRRHSEDTGFLAESIRLTGSAVHQRGATWLLKHHVVDGAATIPPKDVADLCAVLPTLDHWEAKLHVLQCLSVLPVSESEAGRVHHFLELCLGEEAKFVRAWAYSALHHLAVRFPDYRAGTTAALEAALRQETSAAVKVRIRKAIDAGF